MPTIFIISPETTKGTTRVSTCCYIQPALQRVNINNFKQVITCNATLLQNHACFLIN